MHLPSTREPALKYKVTDTLRMESVGAGVGLSEEEVQELVVDQLVANIRWKR